jgi:hypothetical protein
MRIMTGGVGNMNRIESCKDIGLEKLVIGGVVCGVRILTVLRRLVKTPIGSPSNGVG